MIGQPVARVRPLFWNADYTYSPQPRLAAAFERGEVTVGGLAEAGWLPLPPGPCLSFIRRADRDDRP